MHDHPLPSDGELEILRVLWKHGAATVKEIHDRLPRRSEIGYNTVGKLLQIMVGKGLVRRDSSARAHVFSAVAESFDTERSLVRDLANRAFGGSAGALALRALGSGELSSEEIAELRTLLAELEA